MMKKRFTFLDLKKLNMRKKTAKDVENLARKSGEEITFESNGVLITGTPELIYSFSEEMAKIQENKELKEVREIANRLNDKCNEYQNQILELRRDKGALVLFIEDNIQDKELLETILPTTKGEGNE